jgi:hypothetical protein
MRALLPSVWLVGAALYTVSILSLTKPFSGTEDWPAPLPVNETVVAKTPLAVLLEAATPGEGPLVPAAAVVPKPKVERRNEWVQVAGYTTVVRSRPSAEAAPLYAYAVGRPLRVIAREGHFVRVQDLGSGQLGWIEEASLVPFFGGYRERAPVADPQIAAVAPPAQTAPALAAALAVEPVAAVLKPQIAAVATKKPRQQHPEALSSRPGTEAVAAVETTERGLFRKKRGVQRVALGGKETGFAGMIGRAFRGF